MSEEDPWAPVEREVSFADDLPVITRAPRKVLVELTPDNAALIFTRATHSVTLPTLETHCHNVKVREHRAFYEIYKPEHRSNAIEYTPESLCTAIFGHQRWVWAVCDSIDQHGSVEISIRSKF